MSVSVSLSDNKTHLIYELQDPLDMKQLLDAYDEEKIYRDSLPYTVHSIVDMSKAKNIPPKWLVAKTGPGLSHPRSGYILFVGVSFGLKMMTEMILKMTQYDRMKFFDTREEADAYIAELTMKVQTEDPI